MATVHHDARRIGVGSGGLYGELLLSCTRRERWAELSHRVRQRTKWISTSEQVRTENFQSRVQVRGTQSNTAMTGAWSEAPWPLRSSRSIRTVVQRRVSDSVVNK